MTSAAVSRHSVHARQAIQFDEVTLAQGSKISGEFPASNPRLGAERNRTIPLVTPQMGRAKHFSDRACLFHAGKIAGQRPPDQLFGNPQNEGTKTLSRPFSTLDKA